MAAYQAHDRVVAADAKQAATLACSRTGGRPGSKPNRTRLRRWWCWPPAGRRWTGSTAPARSCWPPTVASAASGSRVEDRQLAVGDRVVCGHNAIAELGVANGSRGTITALDPQTRTLTIRLDGTDSRTVILPGSYLDGRGRGERNRRVDLAYAITGHRAQG